MKRITVIYFALLFLLSFPACNLLHTELQSSAPYKSNNLFNSIFIPAYGRFYGQFDGGWWCRYFSFNHDCENNFLGVYNPNTKSFLWKSEVPAHAVSYSLTLGHLAYSENYWVVIRNLRNGNIIKVLEHVDPERTNNVDLIYTYDSKYLFKANFPASIKIWDTRNYSEFKIIKLKDNIPVSDEFDNSISHLSYNNKQNLVAITLHNGETYVLNMNNYTFTQLFKNEKVFSATFGSEGSMLIQFYGDEPIRIVNYPSLETICTIESNSEFLRDSSKFTFSPDGKYLIATGGGGIHGWGPLIIYNASSGKIIKTIKKYRTDYYDIFFTNDGKYFISVDEKMIYIFSYDGSLIRKYKLPKGYYAWSGQIIEDYF